MRSRGLGIGAAVTIVAAVVIVVVVARSGDESALVPPAESKAPTPLRDEPPPSATVQIATPAGALDSEPIDWPDLGPAWPEEGWTHVVIDMSALDHAPEMSLDHLGAGSGRDREIRNALAAGEALEHHYPQARIFSAYEQVSAGVRVVYFEHEGEFFLQEDHMMGHYDPFIGPFFGDPRQVLAELIS